MDEIICKFYATSLGIDQSQTETGEGRKRRKGRKWRRKASKVESPDTPLPRHRILIHKYANTKTGKSVGGNLKNCRRVKPNSAVE